MPCQRRAGKEGFKNDGLATCFTRLPLAFLHKERIGYSQHGQVEKLLDLLADNSSDGGMVLAADRGYGVNDYGKPPSNAVLVSCSSLTIRVRVRVWLGLGLLLVWDLGICYKKCKFRVIKRL